MKKFLKKRAKRSWTALVRIWVYVELYGHFGTGTFRHRDTSAPGHFGTETLRNRCRLPRGGQTLRHDSGGSSTACEYRTPVQLLQKSILAAFRLVVTWLISSCANCSLLHRKVGSTSICMIA